VEVYTLGTGVISGTGAGTHGGRYQNTTPSGLGPKTRSEPACLSILAVLEGGEVDGSIINHRRPLMLKDSDCGLFKGLERTL